MNTDQIPTAILIHMAITMDFPEILALCDRDEEFNKGVCLNKWFWKTRLLQDYDIRDIPSDTTSREYFSKIYKLEKGAKTDYTNLLMVARGFGNVEPGERLVFPDKSQLSRNDVMELFDSWAQKYNLVYSPEHLKDIRLDLHNILHNKNKKDIIIPLVYSPSVHPPTMNHNGPIPVVPSTISGGKTSPRVTLQPVVKK